MPYDDGLITIYLNTKGKLTTETTALADLLAFMENSTAALAVNDSLKMLHTAVTAVKNDEGVQKEAMKFHEILYEERKEGLEEGLEKGLEKGALSKLIDLVTRKVSRGKDPLQIAEDLEEDPDVIRKIVDASVKFAPDYDTKKILETMEQESISHSTS